MTPDVDPLDTFKRAMTATMRAIAENEEMEVSFGKGGTSVQGNNVRVPQPNYGCSDTELNAVRGIGDEIALKMRYHDCSWFIADSPPLQDLLKSSSSG